MDAQRLDQIEKPIVLTIYEIYVANSVNHSGLIFMLLSGLSQCKQSQPTLVMNQLTLYKLKQLLMVQIHNATPVAVFIAASVLAAKMLNSCKYVSMSDFIAQT